MSWWRRWFQNASPLELRHITALQQWHAIQAIDLNQAPKDLRWVAVDVETSGLDTRRASLISIGAVALHQGVIELADSFDVILRQENVSSTANILVHEIGVTAQTSGEAPRDALTHFLNYLGSSPLIAFHAPFDAAILRRVMRSYLGLGFKPTWLDLAQLAPALFPDLQARCASLDEWLAHFGIRNSNRHNAASDAFSTAQLFQVLLAKAQSRGLYSARDLLQLAKAHRALRQQGL